MPQAAEILGAHGFRRFHLDSDDLACVVLQQRIDLVAVAVPVVVELGQGVTPRQLTGEFSDDEGFEEAAGGGVVGDAA